MSVLITIIVAVILGVVKLWWWANKRNKAHNEIIKTNIDDPAGVADFDERERVQNDRAISTKSKRCDERDSGAES